MHVNDGSTGTAWHIADVSKLDVIMIFVSRNIRICKYVIGVETSDEIVTQFFLNEALFGHWSCC